jgi:hypothetical protein
MDKIINEIENLSLPHHLYLISINTVEDEQFLKIGITSKSVKERISAIRMNVDWKYEIIEDIEMSGFEARAYESLVFERLMPFDTRYKPNFMFSGHTECFNINVKNKLKKNI